MSQYYIGALAFSDFNAISHGRPKGSRNGYTTMSNYKPIGKPAKGKYDPRKGYYIYDNAAGGGRGKSSDYMQRSRISSAHRTTAAAAKRAHDKFREPAGYSGHYDPWNRTYTKSPQRDAAKAKIGSYVGYGANRVKSAYNTVSRYAKTTYKTVSEAVKAYMPKAKEAITKAYGDVVKWVNSTAPKVRKKVQQAIGVVRSCYNTAVSKVSEFGRGAAKKVKEFFKSLPSIKLRGLVKGKKGSATSGSTSIGSGVGQKINNLIIDKNQERLRNGR